MRETPDEQAERRRLNDQLYQGVLFGERSGRMLAPDRQKQVVADLADEGWPAERIADHTRLPLRRVRRFLG